MDDSQNLRATAMIALRDVLRFVQNCAMHVGSQTKPEDKKVVYFRNVLNVGNSNETVQAAVLTTS